MQTPRFVRRAYLQAVSFIALAIVLTQAYRVGTHEDVSLETDPKAIFIAGMKPKNSFRLQHYSPQKSFPGFTLLPVSGNASTLLVNQKGDVVQRWGFDAERVRLLPDCHLLVLHGSKWGLRVDKWRSLKFYVREYDWEGKLVWEHETEEWAHHDAQRLENGNSLFLRRATIPYPAELHPDPDNPSGYAIRSDAIEEVTPDGKLVWSWNVHDHFDLEYCGWRGCPKGDGRLQRGKSKSRKLTGEEAPDRIRDWSHTNTISVVPENRWFDEGDERFRPGNIMIIIRNFWTAYIIDRETGKLVWTYNGNPPKDRPEEGLVRGHDIYMIPKGQPGAGNIVIFDNGVRNVRPHSRIIEVDPTTQEIVWEYSDPKNFFSDAAGSMQRLPNGNTLISEDKSGRIFEVTHDTKETVWELKGRLRVSRAQRYEPNFCPQLKSLPVD